MPRTRNDRAFEGYHKFPLTDEAAAYVPGPLQRVYRTSWTDLFVAFWLTLFFGG